MKRISSRSTFFYKRVFPVFWFGFIAVFILGGGLLSHHEPRASLIPFLMFPLIMGLAGYVIFRKLLFDLADEVWDDGEALVVKNSGVEERVPLSNIINVGFSVMSNPERITLTLRESGLLGKEITFSPLRTQFLPFARNPIVNDLIERVDRARG